MENKELKSTLEELLSEITKAKCKLDTRITNEKLSKSDDEKIIEMQNMLNKLEKTTKEYIINNLED